MIDSPREIRADAIPGRDGDPQQMAFEGGVALERANDARVWLLRSRSDPDGRADGDSTQQEAPISAEFTLRPITDADLPFLLQLYGSTREAELAQVPWTDEQKMGFVIQQFQAQHGWWQEHYKNARFDLVLVNGEPAGRLYVDVWEKEIRIVDIALAPAHRGGGIGSALLRRVFDEGDAAGKPVSIHVEVFNPARRLYHRLGFVETGTHGDVYILMVRPVGGHAPGAEPA